MEIAIAFGTFAFVLGMFATANGGRYEASNSEIAPARD